MKYNSPLAKLKRFELCAIVKFKPSNFKLSQHLILLFCYFVILHFAFFNLQCKKPTPPDDQPSIFLSAEDVGVTDAWIKLRAERMEYRA